MDESRMPASQRLLFQVLSAINTTTEYGTVALKFGWLPIVCALGLTNLYCTSANKPFAHLVGAVPQQ